ncbi:hypothetical protein [Tsukamurella ocularis]|uniref:hypothetical protein n=1 Tax=Tsukamurella ocularis TaxID=1970234 RepID=UPI002168806A|nr:hypothetical protein [Tsukamurella ocularis]
MTGINWDTIGQLNFDRVAENLICRRYPDADQAYAVDGRGGDGGDGGKDIVIRQGNRTRIFQLKYFPEGFSGGFKQTRQRQITKSYNSALRHNPFEWVLVVPRNLTTDERTFVEGLSAGDPDAPIINIIGRKELDDLVIDNPDVDRWWNRDSLREAAKLYQQETSLLLDPQRDLAQRVRDLGSIVDAVDSDWTLDFRRDGDQITQILRPRHNRAHITSPIRVSFSAAFGPEHADLERQLQRSIAFGTADVVELPAEVLSSFRVDGPELVASETTPVKLLLSPVSEAPGIGMTVELRILDENGELTNSHDGKVSYAGDGTEGFSLDLAFCHGKLTVQLLYPRDMGPGDTGTICLSYDLADCLPYEVLQVFALARGIKTAPRFELHLAGEGLLMALNTNQPVGGDDEQSAILEEIAEDLDVLQRHSGVHFTLPSEFTDKERADLRVARILLDGGLAASPSARSYTLPLDCVEDSPQLRALLAGPFRMEWPARELAVELAGKTMRVGGVTVFHPSAVAVNGPEVIAALESGDTDEVSVRFAPSDGGFLYLTLTEGLDERRNTLSESLWGLKGIEQPRPDPADHEAPGTTSASESA